MFFFIHKVDHYRILLFFMSRDFGLQRLDIYDSAYIDNIFFSEFKFESFIILFIAVFIYQPTATF